MSEWKRITKEISFENLPSQMMSAINHHIEQHNLGPILSDVLMCVQTDSEKINKGLFGGTERMQMGAVVTSRWLVWAIQGAKNPSSVLSAQLRNITVQDYAQRQFAKLIADSGIEVNGMFTDVSENTSAFIGLEGNAVGNKFKGIIIKAVQDAKK